MAALKAGKASLPAVDAGPPLEEIHEIEEVPVAAQKTGEASTPAAVNAVTLP